MICKVRMALFGNYNIAATFHGHCTSALNERVGSYSKLEYGHLKGIVEDARAEVTMAFNELERHVAEHGCECEPIDLVADAA